MPTKNSAGAAGLPAKNQKNWKSNRTHWERKSNYFLPNQNACKIPSRVGRGSGACPGHEILGLIRKHFGHAYTLGPPFDWPNLLYAIGKLLRFPRRKY